MGFPRQEYWSGLPILSLGDLPNPRDRTQGSCIGRQVLYRRATREATNAGNRRAYFTAQPSPGCIMIAQSVRAIIMRMKLKPFIMLRMPDHTKRVIILKWPVSQNQTRLVLSPRSSSQGTFSGQRERPSTPLPLRPPLSSAYCWVHGLKVCCSCALWYLSHPNTLIYTILFLCNIFST